MRVLWRSTCETAGLSQQKRTPGHQEKESRLQQREVSQLGELRHVRKNQVKEKKQKHFLVFSKNPVESAKWKDMNAVMTPVDTPRAKDPLKTPRKTPKDLSMAMASKLWLLSPAGWYATMDLEGRWRTRKHVKIRKALNTNSGGERVHAHKREKKKKTCQFKVAKTELKPSELEIYITGSLWGGKSCMHFVTFTFSKLLIKGWFSILLRV